LNDLLHSQSAFRLASDAGRIAAPRRLVPPGAITARREADPTAALAAHFDALDSVVIGTTVGMMIANIPAVFCGHLAGHRLDPRWTRAVASAILAAQAVLVLSGARLF
jgi:hypothetical protein